MEDNHFLPRSGERKSALIFLVLLNHFLPWRRNRYRETVVWEQEGERERELEREVLSGVLWRHFRIPNVNSVRLKKKKFLPA